ncbi:MAG TPA: acetate--CoA ligase family protein [Kofleriaceae bacterium]|nr:acetate--CoA ligase family protein [Kofleriaceae bacterium]
MSASITRLPERGMARTVPIALAGLDEVASDEVVRCLAARGLAGARPCSLEELAAAVEDGALAAAWIDADAAVAASLAAVARAAATAARPLVLLARPARGRATSSSAAATKDRTEHAAALAYLRAHGAAVCSDPDAWLEAVCLVARHGIPEGPRVAVVAPEGSWLAAAAAGIGGADDDARRPAYAASADDMSPADVALVDAATWSATSPDARGDARGDARDGARAATGALLVPVVARAELADGGPAGALWGLRPALAAVTAVGAAAARARAGLGPATRTARGELEVDEEKLERQLGRLGPADSRLGDHETKVLLSAYGVPITRQAVATTASAALRIAKKAGFPVDIKPWGADVPSERDDCPVERNVATAADVRRAYSAVLGHGASAARSTLEEGAVIVRESAPSGREVAATIAPMGALGWTVIVEIAGHGPVAAPAPLRVADASALAQALVATRAGEQEPDRTALANVLRRASHLAVDHAERISKLELGVIVVGTKSERTIVVDAATVLRR